MHEFLSQLMVFWSPAELNANITIFLNLGGALVLGCIVGYERSYHGRAAGMRTYGLVCMASAALVVLVGYPEFWFGGKFSHRLRPIPRALCRALLPALVSWALA